MVTGKRKPVYIVADTIKAIMIIAIIATCVLPMWHVAMASLSKPFSLAATNKFLLKPAGGFSLEGWEIVFSNDTILRGYLNTIIYSLSSTALGAFLATLGAYVISRKNVLLKPFFVVFVVLPMFVNPGLIPNYMVVYKLGFTNTPLALIIPGCLSALNIFLINQGIVSIPESIPEAAEIDGSSHLRTLFIITLPLIVPYIGVVVMFSVIAHWNSWMMASVYLSNEYDHLYPLALIIREILMRNNTNKFTAGSGASAGLYRDSIQMVTILASSLPLIIIYPFLQKHFERAVIIGSVKG